MQSLLEFLIQGIVLGGLYALFAVGITLIFGVLNVINVAHGEFFAVGGYVLFAAVVLLHLPPVVGAVAGGAKLGKTPVRAHDSTGFIVNRLLVPYLLDAIRALEEGVGSIQDIDNSMKLGCGHPMGPLTLLDFVGLDTTYYISQIMFDEFKERRFAAPPLLKRMVLAGWNGRKSGRGFYDYADPQNPKAMKF